MMTVAVTRRRFLVNAGRGTIALAVLGVVGCAPAATASSTPQSPASDPPTGSPASEPSTTGAPATDPGADPEAVAWERVDLGFVSAYVLVRGGEAAVVDTGVAGSDDDIAAALDRLGLDWGAVGHVVLTHLHADHAGSASAVLTAASCGDGVRRGRRHRGDRCTASAGRRGGWRRGLRTPGRGDAGSHGRTHRGARPDRRDPRGGGRAQHQRRERDRPQPVIQRPT